MPDKAGELWHQCIIILGRCFDGRFPWLAKAPGPDHGTEELADAWAKEWGDPNDPAVQERILRTVRELEGADLSLQGGRSAYQPV